MNGQTEKEDRDLDNDDALTEATREMLADESLESTQYRSFIFSGNASEDAELIIAPDDIAANAQARLRLWNRALEGVEVVEVYPPLDGLWQDGGYRVLSLAAPDKETIREWEGQAKELVLAYFEAERRYADDGNTAEEIAERMLDEDALELAVTNALNTLGQFADQLPRCHFMNDGKEWTLLQLVVHINNLQWAQVTLPDNDDFFESCETEIENYFERIRTLLENQDAAQS